MDIRKTIIGLYAGVISLASLSLSFTAAWYAQSARLEVDSLDVEISATRELKISTSDDLSTFVDDLSYDDLHHVGLFSPVSTMFESFWRDEPGEKMPRFYEYSSFFTPSSGIPYDPGEVKSVAENGRMPYFYRQDLYLLADDDVMVTLDPENTFFLPNEDANFITANSPECKKRFPTLSQEEIADRLDSLVNALRCSIYAVEDDEYTIIDPYKNGVTEFGGILDNSNDGFYDTYTETQSSQTKEVIYGEVIGRENAVYSEVYQEDEIYQGERNSFLASIGKGTRHFLKEESLANGLSFGKEKSISLEETAPMDLEENKFKISCRRGEPKHIVLSIYLEGWDLDCINDVMGGNFLSQIQFRILRES